MHAHYAIAAEVGQIKKLASMAHPTKLGRQVLQRYSSFVAVRWLRKLESLRGWMCGMWHMYIMYHACFPIPLTLSADAGLIPVVEKLRQEHTLSAANERWDDGRNEGHLNYNYWYGHHLSDFKWPLLIIISDPFGVLIFNSGKWHLYIETYIEYTLKNLAIWYIYIYI